MRQLQHGKSASIATSQAFRLQLSTCNQYNFYQKNYNSTSTPVATRQALKMQLFRALKLQLKKLSSSDYYNKTIATCRVLENHSLGENL
jgi:hypothetical protein